MFIDGFFAQVICACGHTRNVFVTPDVHGYIARVQAERGLCAECEGAAIEAEIDCFMECLEEREADQWAALADIPTE